VLAEACVAATEAGQRLCDAAGIVATAEVAERVARDVERLRVLRLGQPDAGQVDQRVAGIEPAAMRR
jgi:hypothetical protein